MINYSPSSHFFVDYTKLSDADITNWDTDAFGPQNVAESDTYRTTSFVRSSELTKVFAVCDGQILIQPQTGDTSKINLILKVAPNANYGPIKIKYFIYRGVNKADLIDGNNLQPINEGSIDQPTFLFNIWKEFKDFNMPFFEKGIIEEPPDTIPAVLLGYDENQSEDTLLDFYFRRNFEGAGLTFYQMPYCKKGEYLGNFTGKIGLDIVLDYGDFMLTNQDELFKFDLAFARKADHLFDITTIQDSTATKVKRYKECIHQFLDAAAFWGSHIDCGRINRIGSSGEMTSNADIYTNILKKYQTKNKIYVFIQAERTRSYNYYDSNRKVYGIDSSEILNNTNGWPIIIKEKTFSSSNHSLKIGLDYSISRNIDPLNRNVSLVVITPNNDLSVYPKTDRKEGILGYIGKVFLYDITQLFSNKSFVKFDTQQPLPAGLELNENNSISGIPTTHEEKNITVRAYKTLSEIEAKKNITISINPIIETLPIKFAFNETKSCANFVFIFADINQENYPNEYYNNLWSVNLGSTFKIPDNEQNLIHWLNYDKNQVKNFDVIQKGEATIVQQKIVFDNGVNQEVVGPNPPTKKRRTYIAGIKSNSVLNTRLFTSGFEKRILDSRVYSYRLFYDTSFAFYKGEFKDNTQTIQTLTLFNNNDYTKKFNYLLLGITEEEYNKLIYDNPTPTIVPPNTEPIQILPKDADNVFFYLEEDYEFINQNVKKFKIGLQYEDNAGVLQILYPSENNSVYVYTIDGYFFCSPEYTDYQQFYKILPKAKAEFRVTQPYAGEFGFDWMRVSDTGATGDVNYENRVGKLYYDEAHTKIVMDINEYRGYFNEDTLLYNKLELEYTPFPIQYKNEEEIQRYYVPKLSIYPEYRPISPPGIDLDTQPILGSNPDLIYVNRIAKISLNISIATSPQRIEMQYDTNVLEVVNLTGPFDLQELECTYNLTIRSKVSFGTDQIIKVIADYGGQEEIIGLLKVKANDPSLRKSKKTVLIAVRTNINGTVNVPSVNDKAIYMMKYIRQLLITPVFVDIELDLTVAPIKSIFESDYVFLESTQHSPPKNVVISKNPNNPSLEELHTFLAAQNVPGTTTSIGTFYSGNFILFFFQESGGKIDADGFQGLNGYSSGNYIVGFDTADNSTATHEFLHSANLPHSFTAYEADKYAKYTYKPLETDNIMDYSHSANPPLNRVSLWDWQAVIAKKVSNDEP